MVSKITARFTANFFFEQQQGFEVFFPLTVPRCQPHILFGLWKVFIKYCDVIYIKIHVVKHELTCHDASHLCFT